ncbi:hypothetical protein NT2_02_05600 [Caenibius tardaugens NBRC 16725]|uniref:DUF541 domain-containing protein n=1 Tax=Caenibius tardaugens NBRC 16725 TaxID=1219035 RepID=U2Y5S0_9SPHN|nr:SIMPL domain-containing protein [Caenibius tardaugens]AZI34933.1 DUF541 domain-containing protein [Caenibius tardaugens NBRC 16725]GAD48476.1 hypothetical protein NT2_02_05600 [Caenibius tardaugens NBRC 16725]
MRIMITRLPIVLGLGCALAACGERKFDPRGLEYDETLLSVSATGQTDTRPDQAQFQAGISNASKSAKEASAANLKKIDQVVSALKQLGIAEKDIQTRAMSVQRVDWGDRQGLFEANNIINVIVRDVDKAGAAVTAASEAGANVISGPDLRLADPEKSANTAYAAAYKAARNRAEAYAKAADMKISRVLTIRDAGGVQGNRYMPAADAAAASGAVVYAEREEARPDTSRIMAGETNSTVAIQVDFALTEK